MSLSHLIFLKSARIRYEINLFLTSTQQIRGHARFIFAFRKYF
jgi:hypothetical protein